MVDMKGLRYQLKCVLHDKFCLMTFLLPIVIAAALNFTGSVDFSSLGEFHFGIVKDTLPEQTVTWLKQYGPVTAYQTPEQLKDAINEPSTNEIGVEADGDGIKTIVSGDELDLFRQAANTLPALYKQRRAARQVKPKILERPDVMKGFKDMFIAATLVIAMFMGCTFNAMNMISEKEDGVAFVNEILPMTRGEYIIQKLTVGFICGCLSSIITACICLRIAPQNVVPLLLLIILSSFVSALTGLFIGRISNGLMVGMIYIKVVMLLFIAIPVLCFLVGVSHPLLSAVCYLIPSQAAFEGIIGISAGSTAMVLKDIFLLTAHCIGWFLLYAGISMHQRKNT